MPGKPVWAGSRKKPYEPRGTGPNGTMLVCGHRTYADPVARPASPDGRRRALYECQDGCPGLHRRQTRKAAA